MPPFYLFSPPSDPSKVCFICKLPPKRPTDSYRIAVPEDVKVCFSLPIAPPDSGRICARHYHLLRLFHADSKKLFPFEHCRAISDRKRIVCSLADDSLQPTDPESPLVAFVMNSCSVNIGPSCEFYIPCKSVGPTVDVSSEDTDNANVPDDSSKNNQAVITTRSRFNNDNPSLNDDHRHDSGDELQAKTGLSNFFNNDSMNQSLLRSLNDINNSGVFNTAMNAPNFSALQLLALQQQIGMNPGAFMKLMSLFSSGSMSNQNSDMKPMKRNDIHHDVDDRVYKKMKPYDDNSLNSMLGSQNSQNISQNTHNMNPDQFSPNAMLAAFTNSSMGGVGQNHSFQTNPISNGGINMNTLSNLANNIASLNSLPNLGMNSVNNMQNTMNNMLNMQNSVNPLQNIQNMQNSQQVNALQNFALNGLNNGGGNNNWNNSNDPTTFRNQNNMFNQSMQSGNNAGMSNHNNNISALNNMYQNNQNNTMVMGTHPTDHSDIDVNNLGYNHIQNMGHNQMQSSSDLYRRTSATSHSSNTNTNTFSDNNSQSLEQANYLFQSLFPKANQSNQSNQSNHNQVSSVGMPTLNSLDTLNYTSSLNSQSNSNPSGQASSVNSNVTSTSGTPSRTSTDEVHTNNTYPHYGNSNQQDILTQIAKQRLSHPSDIDVLNQSNIQFDSSESHQNKNSNASFNLGLASLTNNNGNNVNIANFNNINNNIMNIHNNNIVNNMNANQNTTGMNANVGTSSSNNFNTSELSKMFNATNPTSVPVNGISANSLSFTNAPKSSAPVSDESMQHLLSTLFSSNTTNSLNPLASGNQSSNTSLYLNDINKNLKSYPNSTPSSPFRQQQFTISANSSNSSTPSLSRNNSQYFDWANPVGIGSMNTGNVSNLSHAQLLSLLNSGNNTPSYTGSSTPLFNNKASGLNLSMFSNGSSSNDLAKIFSSYTPNIKSNSSSNAGTRSNTPPNGLENNEK